MEKDILNEAFESFNRPTTKKFSDIFKIEPTKLGNQLIAVDSVKIGDKELNQGATLVNGELKIDNISIYDLQDKYLVGTTNIDNNVFNITGFKDTL